MRIAVRAAWFAAVLSTALGAQVAAAASLITQATDETNLAVLAGNVRPEATAENDRGPIAPETVLEHMHLQLQRGDAGERAVEAFVASQYDPASPQFHQWLSPENFGARFGVADADIERITSWLASHGLTVNAVLPSRMVIDFSGTAGQVASAFHTELHRLDVGGVAHIANVSDPQIPAALAPAIAGIVSLHDFRAHSRYRPSRRETAGGGDYPVTPGDLAIIYNFKAAFAAGITGKGQTIAAVEDTNLFSDADWTNFRKIFGLSGYTAGSLTVEHPVISGTKRCGNPGVNGDDGEATLDVEFASAAAPAAQIVLASCAATAATDGVYLAAQLLVNAKSPPPIITVSYGECETENGQASNQAFAALWKQAAAEGISVFVATGDNGPSDCALDGEVGARLGIGANGWATSQYNVAVGGTDFSDTFAGTNATYWNAHNTAQWVSAKSYVPEIPWNGNCGSLLIAKSNGFNVTYGAKGFCNAAAGSVYQELDGGEGSPSGCATGVPAKRGVVSGTCKGTPRPSWQAGVPGIPGGGVRWTPDVSLFAANGGWNHEYVTCFSDPNGGSPCTGNPANWQGNGGGTSYATPIWAGIQALVNQKQGKKQGNPAPVLYKLAAAEYGKTGNAACNASLGNKIGTGCVFNDITQGDDNSDCVKGSPNCFTPSGSLGVLSLSTTAYEPAYRAGVGYNVPTGLGSVNVTNLIGKWPISP